MKIFEKNRNLNWLENKISIALKFSLDNILFDGTSQYIGRGQEQIFGYGSLIAALKIFQKIFKKNLEKQIDLLVTKVLSHQKKWVFTISFKN